MPLLEPILTQDFDAGKIFRKRHLQKKIETYRGANELRKKYVSQAFLPTALLYNRISTRIPMIHHKLLTRQLGLEVQFCPGLEVNLVYTIAPSAEPATQWIHVLVQERRHSIALAMELRLSCTNPLVYLLQCLALWINHLLPFICPFLWKIIPNYNCPVCSAW